MTGDGRTTGPRAGAPDDAPADKAHAPTGPPTGAEPVAARLAAIRLRIDNAARAAGRPGDDVRIVAVTKRQGTGAIRAAYAAGQRDFGENYVQEAVGKIAELSPHMPDARWHFVGRLQSNKAAVAVRSFRLLHGIDAMSTVAALSRAAEREGRVADLLLQVRLGQRGAGGAGAAAIAVDATSRAGTETTAPAGDAASATAMPRAGVEPDEAATFLEQASAHPGVRFVGLMGVADPDLPARPQFASLRELAATLAGLGLAHAPLGELSMGMTGDFEDAVAEGATIVRIGTAIFGERPRG